MSENKAEPGLTPEVYRLLMLTRQLRDEVEAFTDSLIESGVSDESKGRFDAAYKKASRVSVAVHGTGLKTLDHQPTVPGIHTLDVDGLGTQQKSSSPEHE